MIQLCRQLVSSSSAEVQFTSSQFPLGHGQTKETTHLVMQQTPSSGHVNAVNVKRTVDC